MLLGSGFSPAFANVILIANLVILSCVLLGAFFDEIAEFCAKVWRHSASRLAFLITHLRPRHR